ncbi:MAG: hypothetical protein COA78_04530 [Blastopirellula sp.]|nr:MAG: hypothetical protein COA78_04530 [Blastopirellula sp.]
MSRFFLVFVLESHKIWGKLSEQTCFSGELAIEPFKKNLVGTLFFRSGQQIMTGHKSHIFAGTAAIASVILTLISFNTVAAQVPVYAPVQVAPAMSVPPAVIGYVPERRGWFRQRTTYRPVLAAPPVAPVTTYYRPAPVTTYYMPAAPRPATTTYYMPAAPRPATTTYYMPAPATTTYRVPSYWAPTVAAPGVTTYYQPAAPTVRAYYPQATTVPGPTVIAPPVTTYYPTIPATTLPTRQLPSGASVPRTQGMPIIGF